MLWDFDNRIKEGKVVWLEKRKMKAGLSWVRNLVKLSFFNWWITYLYIYLINFLINK